MLGSKDGNKKAPARWVNAEAESLRAVYYLHARNANITKDLVLTN